MTYIRFYISGGVICACHCCSQPIQHNAIECTVPTKIVDAQIQGIDVDSSMVMEAAKWDGVTLNGLEFTNQVHVMDFVPEPKTTEELAAQARAERDQLLAATDWTQAADVPQATKDKWAPYRQALRDVTAQTKFPDEITWPVKPE